MIKKHVAIIHAYSLMSILQRKVFNVLLHDAISNQEQIEINDGSTIESRISFLALAKAINFNSNNTQYLREAIDDLASLKIEWNLLKDKVPTHISFLNLRVLHGSPTFYKDGTFHYSFHKLMLELVKNPQVYGQINIDLQSQFESKYAHSLYENSTRFVNLEKSKFIQLDVVKKLLGINENSYCGNNIRELTRSVLKPAIEEVNDRSSFIVNLDPVRLGRSTTGFEIVVVNKDSNISSRINRGGLTNEIKLVFQEISDKTLQWIISNYSAEYIKEKIKYTKDYAKKDSEGNYPVRYFISALKQDYKPKITLKPLNEIESNNEDNSQAILFDLQSELEHWKRNLDILNASVRGDRTNIGLTEKLISKCEEKIRNHKLEHPHLESEDR